MSSIQENPSQILMNHIREIISKYRKKIESKVSLSKWD